MPSRSRWAEPAKKFDEENLPDLEVILSDCAGLVTVNQETDVVRFIHYTTQEYFQRTCGGIGSHARSMVLLRYASPTFRSILSNPAAVKRTRSSTRGSWRTPLRLTTHVGRSCSFVDGGGLRDKYQRHSLVPMRGGAREAAPELLDR